MEAGSEETWEETRKGIDGKQEESMKGKRSAAERSATGETMEKKEKLREKEESFIQYWLILGNEVTITNWGLVHTWNKDF